MSDDVDALAELLFESIVRGDVDTLRERVYSPDVIVWHNDSGTEQGLDDNLKVLRWMGRNITGLRYEDVRRVSTATWFVQQHVLRGTVGGGELEVPACLVVAVADGRIVRIDEYLDAAALAPLGL